MKKPASILLFLFATGSLFSQKPDFIKDSLDTYITQGLQDWQVPGLAIVIAKDGKIVKMKGYGVMDIVSKKPITEHSLFFIASNTKFFTATVLVQMQYNKIIKLDDKFTEYFPDFRLYNDNQNFIAAIRHQVLDYYADLPYRNRSKLYLRQFKEDQKEISDTINSWKNRVKGNSPPLSIVSFTGQYVNAIYGSLDISIKNNRLTVKFNSHDHLLAKLDYLDYGEWLVQYNNIENGFFTTRFRTENTKVISVEIKENGLADIDPYVFLKQ